MNSKPVNIALFASGEGTNAQRIIDYFNNRAAANDRPLAKVALIVCNNPQAGVLHRAKKAGIPLLMISKKDLEDKDAFLKTLRDNDIGFIALAGFLWLIPSFLPEAFPEKIVNIHPALLPKYGGKGMYGSRVHSAVIAAHEKESGISVHFVNSRFDEGKIIFQAKCEISPGETPETLAAKIHGLEYRYYPETIEKLITSPEAPVISPKA